MPQSSRVPVQPLVYYRVNGRVCAVLVLIESDVVLSLENIYDHGCNHPDFRQGLAEIRTAAGSEWTSTIVYVGVAHRINTKNTYYESS